MSGRPRVKLDLGCGRKPRAGFIGVDMSAACSPDVLHDLRTMPWPFDDASVDEVYSGHFLEHLDGEERIAFMEELYRVLRPGGTALIVTPYWSWVGAVQDPTHKWPPIAEQSYHYFSKALREQMGVDFYPIRCDFDVSFGFSVLPQFAHLPKAELDRARAHSLNVVAELRATLVRR